MTAHESHVTVRLTTPSREQSLGDGQVTVTRPSHDPGIGIWYEGNVTAHESHVTVPLTTPSGEQS